MLINRTSGFSLLIYLVILYIQHVLVPRRNQLTHGHGHIHFVNTFPKTTGLRSPSLRPTAFKQIQALLKASVLTLLDIYILLNVTVPKSYFYY
jgi:hypothetical protein